MEKNCVSSAFTGDIGFDFVAAFLGFVLHIYNFPLYFVFALWYNGYAKPHIPFAAGRCFVLDENPLGFPPMYPCSYGIPIDFAVSCGFSHSGVIAHGSAHGIRCAVHRCLIAAAAQKQRFLRCFHTDRLQI